MAFDVEQFLNQREVAAKDPGFDSDTFVKDYERGSNNFARDIDRTQIEDRGGFITQTAESLAGGATDAAELWMRALRAIDPEGGSTVIRDFATFGLDSIKNFVAKHPSLAPDENVEKGVKTWWTEGVRSLIPSLSTSIIPIAAGIAAAPFTGGTSLPGIAAGSGAMAGAVFGLAEFDKFHEEVEERIDELGMGPEEADELRAQARTPAIFSALTEGGLEAAANALQTLTLGRFLPGKRALKDIAKAPLRSLFTKTTAEGLKSAGKQLAVTVPAEVGTEFAQAALETKFRRDINLTDLSSISAGFQAMGPAFVTSLLFFGAGKTVNAAQRYSIRKNLEDAKANPGKRLMAARKISETIRATGEPGSAEMATNIVNSAKSFINSKTDMNLDTETGIFNLMGEYAQGLRKGEISVKNMRKIEKQLHADLQGELISPADRNTAQRFANGVTTVTNAFEDFERSELVRRGRAKDATKAQKNEADMLVDIANEAIEPSAKEVGNTKIDRPEPAEVTGDAQAALLINGREAMGEDMSLAREQAEIENEQRDVEASIKAKTKADVGVEKGEAETARIKGVVQKAEQAEIEAGVAKKTAAERRAIRLGQEPDIAEVIAKKKEEAKAVAPEAKLIEEEEVTAEEEVVQPVEEGEVIDEPEVTTISTEQEKDIRKELKDPDITTEERKDLESALTKAGLPIKKVPTERQRKRLRTQIDKAIAKQVGVPAVGKAPKKVKGAKEVKPTEAKEISTQRSKLIQQLGTLRKNKDSAQNDKLIEEVRTQIDELQARSREIQEGNRESNQIKIEDTIIDISEDISLQQAADEAVAFIEASQIEQADLSVVDKKGVKTTFLGITPELIKTGQVNFKGRTISGARELAAMTQVFSNPQFETLRIFYLKGRTIMHHEGITSRLPNQIQTFRADVQLIENKREEIGADAVYMVHNHPSGDPTPSKADAKATQNWNNVIKGLRGHVVINSGKFAFINPQGETQIANIETQRPDLEASIPNRIVKERIKSGNDIAELTKRMQNPKGFINAVYLSTKNDVRSLQEIPISFTKNSREMASILREQAKHSGSAKTFLTFNKNNHPELASDLFPFKKLIATGIVADVLIYSDTSLDSVKQEFGLETIKDINFFFGERVEQFAVAEEGKKIEFKSEIPKAKTAKEGLDNKAREDHPDAAKIQDEKLGPRYKARTVKEIFDAWTTNLMVRVRQGVFDQYASLKVLDEKLWKLVQLTTSVNGAVETLFNWGGVKLDESGVINILDDEGGKGLSDILKPLGDEVENWLSWVAANRANKLIKVGKERNLTQPEIDILMKTNEGTMADGKSRKSVYRKANNQLMALHKSVLDVAVKTGAINKEERESWDTDFYVPFFRVLEERPEVRGPKTLGGLTNQTAIKNLKGSPVPVADMLTNIMMNWNHILSASMKNQAANETLTKASQEKIADGRPVAEQISDDFIIQENAEGKFEIIHVESKKVKGTKDTYAEADAREEELVNLTAHARAQRGDRIVYVRQNGRKVWYEVNEPNIYNAIANLQWNGFNNTAMKAMRKFKRMLTFGVTFSPDFKVRNLIRDTVSSVGVSPISVNIFDNVFGAGRKHTAKNSAEAARYRAGGGFIEFGHTYGTDPEKEAAQIRRNLKKENILDNATARKKVQGLLGRAMRRWNDLGSRAENMNRAALASQEAGKGKSLLEANFQARDLLDLNRHGAWPAVRFLIDVVPFMNARLQGLDKLGRALGGSKAERNRALTVIAAVGLASSALYVAFKDDEDFKAREEWDRDTYWWFKMPGAETAFRIPKPFEIGAIGTLAERLVEQFADDKVHGELFIERLKFAVTQTFAFDVMPQIAKPLLELSANKNFFTDRPIETLGMQRLSPTERRKAWTSETAIGLSLALNKIPWEKVQLSPVQVEHLVQGYLGWLGATSVGFVDQVLIQPTGAFPGRPSKRIEEVPLVGSFLRTTPARQTKYSTLFYEQLKEMNQTYADIRNFRTLGETEKALNLARKEKDNLKFRKFANKIQKQIAAVSKRIKLARLSKTMLPREKRIQIDRLTEIKNRLLKMSVEKITQ